MAVVFPRVATLLSPGRWMCPPDRPNNPQMGPRSGQNTWFLHSRSGVSGTKDEGILVEDSHQDQRSGQGVATKSRAEWGRCFWGVILSRPRLDLLWETSGM